MNVLKMQVQHAKLIVEQIEKLLAEVKAGKVTSVVCIARKTNLTVDWFHVGDSNKFEQAGYLQHLSNEILKQ